MRQVFLKATAFAIALTVLTAGSAQAQFECKVDAEGGLLQPGKWVAVTDTPFIAEGEGAAIWVYIEIDGENTAVPAWADDADTFRFKAPASLKSPWEEVAVDEFWLTDGEVGCDIEGLRRGAMRQRNGIFEAMLMGNVIGMQARLRQLGIDPETRVYTDTGAPVTDRDIIRPMMEAKRLYRDYKALESDAQNDPDLSERIAVLNAYFEASGAAELILKNADADDDLARLFEDTQAQKGGHLRRGMIHRMRAPASVGATIMSAKAPESPEELAEMLRLQLGSSSANSPFASYFRDTAGTFYGAGALMLEVGGAKPVAKIYGAAAHTLFLDAMMHKIKEGLYPESFDRIEVVGGPYNLRLNEEPTEGELTGIWVVPRAKGLNVAGLIADAAINFMPFVKRGRAAKGRIAKRLGADPAVIKESVKSAVDVAKSAPKVFSKNGDELVQMTMKHVTELFEGFYKQAFGMVSGNSNYGNVATIKPFTYPRVDIFEPGWYEARPEHYSFLNWNIDPAPKSIRYSSKANGDTKVTIRNMPGKFAAANIQTIQTIRVQKPGILVDPMRKIVMPGTPIIYQAAVVGVDIMQPEQRRMKVLTEEGFIASNQGYATNGGLETVTYRVETASSPDAYPSTVTFLSEEYAELMTERVIETPTITPDATCVPPGETIEFQALDEVGKPLSDAQFFLEGPGQLTRTGLYTAPARSTRTKGKTVTVKLGTRPDAIVDTMDFTIGCSCEWSVNVAGLSDGGRMVSVSEMPGELSRFTMMTMDGEKLFVGVAGEGPIRSPKTTNASIQAGERSFVSAEEFNFDPTADCAAPKARRSRWSLLGDRWLQGRISGEVIEVSELLRKCPPIKSFTFSFTADLGGENKASTGSILDGLLQGGMSDADPEAREMISAIGGLGLSTSACFDTVE